MKYKSFKDMDIWKEAMEVAVEIFKITETLPRKEDYGFTSQVRRSALSISANIAEAFGRNHKLEKLNFYYFARGSVAETQNHLEYGKRVGYIKQEIFEDMEEKLEILYQKINRLTKFLKGNR